MHHKLDTTRPRSRSRIALSVATAVACLVMVTGCSDDGPKPEDQREQMVATTEVVVEELTDRLELVGLVVLDGGSETVECTDGGVQYRYSVEGTTGDYAWLEDDAEEALADAGALINGILLEMPEVQPFAEVGDTWFDPDWDGDRTITYQAEDGAESGMSLVFDLTAETAVTMDVQVTGTTTCG